MKSLVEKAYKDKRILITGHTGFKGSWLAMFLNRLGAKVAGVALAPETKDDHFVAAKCEIDLIEHHIGDITNPNLVAKIVTDWRPDIVFHLAAQPLVRRSYDDPIETYNTNVMGSLRVLEAIRYSVSTRALVYVTSDKCYRNNEWVWGYRETDELGGHDPYSASKALAELLFASHWKSFFASRDGFGAATVRAGNVIGGGDFAVDRIVPDCVRAVVAGQPIALRSPRATRPWQHVLDPIYGYILMGAKLMNSPKEYSGAWNFGPDAKSIRTVADLAKSFIKLWPGVQVQDASAHDKPHEAGLLHLNCDKAHHKLDWFPVWDFDTTMANTIEWYEAWSKRADMRKVSLAQINRFWESLK